MGEPVCQHCGCDKIDGWNISEDTMDESGYTIVWGTCYRCGKKVVVEKWKQSNYWRYLDVL